MQQSALDKFIGTMASAWRSYNCNINGDTSQELCRGDINNSRQDIFLKWSTERADKRPLLFLPSGVQPLPLRQRSDVGQRLLQETRRQEVAQHGQPELHEEVH